VLDLLVPEKLISVQAPLSVEVNVTEKDNNILVHLINYHAEKESGLVEELPSIKDITVSISTDLVRPGEVFLIPDKKSLECNEQYDQITVIVPELTSYSIVVFPKQ